MLQRVVAVAASAGGVEALGAFLAELPSDLPAAVLVGLHTTPSSPSLLASVLSRRSSLPVLPGEGGLALTPGQVVASVPDRHLLVVDGRIVLGRGARENMHRPAHDAMLRSAALEVGTGAVGVVLTGLLDDGAAGLRCVRRYGGTCLVQDPEDAEYADMPRNALRAVPDARVGDLKALAEEVVAAVTQELPERPHVDPARRELDRAELASALGEPTALPDGTLPGVPSEFACPECHGVLNSIPDGDVVRFRCRTGHAWTDSSLVVEQGSHLEEALWASLRAMEERADLSGRLADRAERDARPWSAKHHRDRQEQALRSAETLREVLRTAIAEPLLPPAAED